MTNFTKLNKILVTGLDDKENSCAGLSTGQSSARAEQSTEVHAGDWSGRN